MFLTFALYLPLKFVVVQALDNLFIAEPPFVALSSLSRECGDGAERAGRNCVSYNRFHFILHRAYVLLVHKYMRKTVTATKNRTENKGI